MIDKSQVAVHPGILGDLKGNYYTSCRISFDELPRLVEECWHLRQTYHCDDLFRVPIPVTHNAKPVFFTGIVPYSGNVYLNTIFEASPLNRGCTTVIVMGQIEYGVITAKFAELIVASKEWLLREMGSNGGLDKPYVVVNFRGLPDKEVPQTPMEMVKRMTGPHSSHYRYSADDLVSAITYWSHHCFIKTQ